MSCNYVETKNSAIAINKNTKRKLGRITEKGPKNVCSSDAECRCRVFNGWEFLEGSENSKCCLVEGGCIDMLSKSIKYQRCFQCYYE